MSVSDHATFASQTPLRIGAVALAVRDLDRTATFYRRVLGLVIIEEGADRIRLGVDGTIVIEIEHRPESTADDQRAAGLFHAAFLMPSRTELARWLRHFASQGLTLDGASDHLVSEALYLSDPEGNGIEVYADRPRDAWRYGEQGLDMGTYPLDLPDLLAAGEGAPEYVEAPAGLRIGHIHLRVGGLERAEAFYSGLLGMEVMTRVPGATFMASGGYHHHVGANVWRSRGAGTRDSQRAGLARFEVEASPDAYADLARRISDAGLVIDESEQRLAVSDPWNNRILIRQV